MSDDIKELVKRLRDGDCLDIGAAADALEAMAGEAEAYESARMTWAESMRAWINRATVAERERDRLKAALEQIKALGFGSPTYKLGRNIKKAVEIARKALGGDAS